MKLKMYGLCFKDPYQILKIKKSRRQKISNYKNDIVPGDGVN